MATLFMDWQNGNNSNNGTSFALRVQDMKNGATSGRTAAGDTWRMMKTEDPVSLGINATFTNKSDTVTLASSLTANIDTCEAAWTAVSANVTQSNPTTRKEGSKSIQFNIAAAFTTGQIAYLTLASTNFSTYNKVSFWIKPTINIASGALKLMLCSDTLGVTAVNTITINEPLAANSWRCITVDTGGALGAAIQSISFNAISDPGTVNIQLDNILACNNLTLTSVISLNSTATGYGTMNWYPVKSINGTTVKIDGGTALDAATTGQGYYGSTTTATCYKIEPIRVNTTGQVTNKAGTSDTVRVTFSGGWDTTNMTSQTGLTFLDFGDSVTLGINIQNNFISFDHIVCVRGSNGIFCSTTSNTNIDNCAVIDGNVGITLSASTYNRITNFECYNNGIGSGFTMTSSNYNNYFNNIICNNNQSIGFNPINIFLGVNITSNNNLASGTQIASAALSRIYNLTSKDNATNGLAATTCPSFQIIGITTSGNTTAGINCTLNSGVMLIDNPNCTDTTPFKMTADNGRIQLSRIGGDPAVSKVYDGSATLAIQKVTSPVHGSTTYSRELSPQSNHIANFPLLLRLLTIAVAAGVSTTVGIWVQRSTTTIGAQMLIRGGQDSGMANDLTAVASAAINTWEQLSITFTPSQNVLIEIEIQAWQISTGGNAFFGDFSVI